MRNVCIELLATNVCTRWLFCYFFSTAANVTIISSDARRDPNHAFLAVVTRFWALDDQNCSRFENHTLIIIRTSLSHCQPCPDFNTTAGDNVYLVAGYCNDVGWYLPTTDSLVSPWQRYRIKYETRLDTWIENGIRSRKG